MHTLVLVLALTIAAQEPHRPAEVGCVVCHGGEALQFEESVHAGLDFGCTDCHGGDADAFEVEAAHADGFRALRDPLSAVEQCAACHSDPARMVGYGLRTDEADAYWTSAHGRGLLERADPNVATCVSCHGDHAIFTSTDARSTMHKFSQAETCGRCHGDADLMEPYGLASDVVEAYRGSVHGRALLEGSRLSSPACADCHGSHGATPPRVDVVGRTCGQCHSVERGFFEESPHLVPSRQGVLEECVSCHGSHAVAPSSLSMFVPDGTGSCNLCHQDADDPALAVAAELLEGLGDLDSSIAAAELAVREAAVTGLFIEHEHGFLDDARSLRGRARAVTHTLSRTRLVDLLNRGHAMVQQTHASLATKERALRDRKIFTAIFGAVVLLLAAVLQNYRREVYGGWKKSGDPGSPRERGADPPE